MLTLQSITITLSGPSSTVSFSLCNVDLVFLIESLYLIGWSSIDYWHQQLNFIAHMLDGMTISPIATQIGLVVMGWPWTSAFYLNNNGNIAELISNILIEVCVTVDSSSF